MSIGEKLIQIQSKLNAPKNLYNSYGNYSYRSAESILEAVKPLLKEQGCYMMLTDEITSEGDRVYIQAIATICDAETGESISNTAYAREPETKKGSDASQITGAASSYARKYALNGLLLIDDNKDADTDERHDETEARAHSRQDDPLVDADAIDKLQGYAKQVRVPIEQVCTMFHIGTLQDMTQSMWIRAMKMLENTAKQMEGKTA